MPHRTAAVPRWPSGLATSEDATPGRGMRSMERAQSGSSETPPEAMRAVARAGEEGQWRFEQQEACCLTSGFGRLELGTEGGQGLPQLGDGRRRVEHAESHCRHSGLLHVAVGLLIGQRRLAEGLVRSQERVDLGDVHPPQQARVAGG